MNTHIASSTEGYFVMNGAESDYDAERKILAGPFASKTLAETYATFITTDGEFNSSKMLGTLNGVLTGYRYDLLSAKRYFETHGAMDTLSVENTHWQRLDEMICRIDALEEVFQAYVHGASDGK